MSLKNLSQKITIFSLVVMLLLSAIAPTVTYAASLRYYDYTKDTNVTYKWKQLIYLYNSREVSMPYPGILENGVALADCEELFVKALGLSVSFNQEKTKVTITNGIKQVVLTVGSKTATIDGVKQTMSVAPKKLLFADGSTRVFIPSRFVAEHFGYGYVWISSSSTVKITKTLNLNNGIKNFSYNGTFYNVSYKNEEVQGVIPALFYEGTVIAPAKNVFEKAGCIYAESEETLFIQKGNISFRADINQNTAYMNDIPYIMNSMPYRITNCDTAESMIYVPLEFVADFLGFQLTYDEVGKTFTLEETDYTGVAEANPALINNNLWVSEETETVEIEKNMHFQWQEEQTDAIYFRSEDAARIQKIEAYSIPNASVIELYGIQSDQINAFLDNGLLVLQMDDVVFYGAHQFYDNFDDEHLTYALMYSFYDFSMMHLVLKTEDTWHFVDQDGYVQLFLCKEDLDTKDLVTSSVNTTETVYYSDKMIIPLPEQVDKITDKDDYSNLNFQITLAGNHTEFFKDNAIYNPYYMIQNYTITYNEETNATTITFYTRNICGYSYTVEANELQVKVGRPSEIYSKIVVLDPGHGGIDPGAHKNKILEKNLNFKIVNTYLRDAFRNSDIKVYYTRETDVLIDLYDRAAFAAEVGADLFISLHMNANNSSSVNGTEVYYCKENNALTASGLKSSILAKELADSLSKAISTKNRGATSADFVVVKYNTVPAVLIELGFMTNKTELEKLNNSTYQKKAAESIYNTVVHIFEEYPTGR